MRGWAAPARAFWGWGAGGCHRRQRCSHAELSLSLCPPSSIFPSPDQPANVPLIPSALNTGGSLPDLTNLHFPSPLPTPLDPDESAYPSLSGGSSTSNLANTMTHLGISGGMGLGTGYDSPGERRPRPTARGRRSRDPGPGAAEPAWLRVPVPGLEPAAPARGRGRQLQAVAEGAPRARAVCVCVAVSIVVVSSVTFHPIRGSRGAPSLAQPGEGSRGRRPFRG